MKIIFAGTPEFSAPTLQALIASEHNVCAVYTQPDRPSGRGRKIKFGAIKQCALDNQLTVEQPVNFNNASDIATLKSYQPDLMVVVAYGIILPESILTIPKHGCINIHASLLPRWRGAAPIQRALLNGDKETGVTLMQMDKGLDTGDMLAKSLYKIQQNDTSETLHSKLSVLGAGALIKLLKDVENKTLTPTQQTESDASYASKLSKQEALINWNAPVEQVHRNIRGFNPWPVAHTLLNGQAIRIWQANMVSSNTDKTPGTIHVENNRLFVACANGQLEITGLQAANKRKMSAVDFLQSNNLDNLTFS